MKRKGLTIPKEGAWTFEAKDVAADFDNHVRSQLPWYDFVTKGLVHIARHYVSDEGFVVDVGASTGNVGRALHEVVAARDGRIYAVEKSQAMIDALKTRDVGHAFYEGVWEQDVVELDWSTRVKPDLIVCFLVLMFVPPRKRFKLLRDMHENLATGGALVVVDRTALAGGYASQVLNRLTLAGKVGTGVPPKEIVEKELSLSGVQRPLDPRDLPGEPVEWFRFGDFAGWLIEAGK